MIIESYRKDNRLIEIQQDICPEDPTELMIGKFYHWKRDSTLTERINRDEAKLIFKDTSFTLVFPVYMHDHGSISLSLTPFNCRFDSGQVGLIAMKKEHVENIFDGDLEEAKKILQSNLDSIAAYVNGEIYEYVEYELETCKCCGHESRESVDSCGGFYSIDEIKRDREIDETWSKVG